MESLPIGMNLRLDEDGLPVKEANPNIYGIYAREAKMYDAAMVERWKTAMEGILIFAGLFSAAVTAFIIESYQTLQPDSGDLTVDLLYQLTQQVAAMNNGTTIPPNTLLPPPADVAFTASSSAVVTNVLWFISLGLSLACAVSATLVQQWARNYVQTIERRPSAKRRARVRMYLFEGVQRFRMSDIVDGIPALLHCALFTFLLGLVFFIRQISTVLAIVSSVIFGLCVFAYLFATFLSLVAYDSPIQTPLTSLVWREPVIEVLYWTCGHALMIGNFLWSAMTEVLYWTCGHALMISNFLWSYWTCGHAFMISNSLWSAMTAVLIPSWAAVDLLIQELASRLHGCITIVQPAVRRVPSMVSRAEWSVLSRQSDWSTGGIASKSLDEVRMSVAVKKSVALQEREERAFHWLVECLDEDKELLLFIEAVPMFLAKHMDMLSRHTPYDKRVIVSSVFNDPELRVYHRLLNLFEKHDTNLRVVAACVGALAVLDPTLPVDPNGWKDDSSWRHLYSRLNITVKFGPCGTDLQCQIHCLLAKYYARLSVHPSKDVIAAWSWQFPQSRSVFYKWPIKYCQMWNDLLDLEESLFPTRQVGSHLCYLTFAKLAVDVLVMNRGQLTEKDMDSFFDAADVVLDQVVPRVDGGLYDTSFQLPSEHHVLHCRTTIFVLQIWDDVHVDIRFIWRAETCIDRLIHPLKHAIDKLPFELIDQILQQPFIKNDALHFTSIVESLQQLGPTVQLSAQTLANYKVLKALPLGHPNDAVDFTGVDGQSQVQFVQKLGPWLKDRSYFFDFAAALRSLYTLDDTFAQRLALDMVDGVLNSVDPERREMLIRYRSHLQSVTPPEVAVQTEALGRPSRGVQADTNDGDYL